VVIGDRISHSFSFGEYHKDVQPLRINRLDSLATGTEGVLPKQHKPRPHKATLAYITSKLQGII
jgi:hypothetical protein